MKGNKSIKLACFTGLILVAMALLAIMGRRVSFDILFHPAINHLIIILAITGTVVLGVTLLVWQILPTLRETLTVENYLIASNRQLQKSENYFHSAFDCAVTGMALMSQQGKFLQVNRALCRILGYTEQELLKMTVMQIMHPDDLRTHKSFFEDIFNGNIKHYQVVQRYYHKNMEAIWVSSNITLIENDIEDSLSFILQMQNVTAEKTAEEKLWHLAYHDALTGVYNRNRLEQYMQSTIQSTAQGNGFALIFLDLDRFKNVNDTLGHDAGDLLLQIVAKRLKNIVRKTDVIARIGGDEFVAIISNLNKVDQIALIVQKILKDLLQPVMIKGHEIYTTTSIGVSLYPYDGNDIETLMKNADLALYRAKEIGRNNYQFCTPEMTVKAQEKMARQNAIIHALAKNEFELYYQPKLDLAARRVSGVEALLRWHNPEYQHINAEEIIHLAEETGLIITLSDWVLTTACNQVKAWHQQGFEHLSLAVNLSPRQFKQVHFAENLLKILEQTEFPEAHLELEITESTIMQDPEYILKILLLLKEHHIRIAIDNFGTGYSSLDYLRRFDIDEIKIDRMFIQRIEYDESNNAVISAMIAMANKLGIRTIAEGVETRAQYEFLLREKCGELQGFYLIPPANVESITQFLTQPLMQSQFFKENNSYLS